MITKHITVLLLGVLLFVGAVRAADRIAAKDIKFTFTNPPVVPERDVPKVARVTPGRSQGAFSNVVAGRISAFTVSWSDAAVFGTTQDTEDFLRRLLTTSTGSTFTHVPWAQALGVPTFAATVQHIEGKSGRLLVWYEWPSVYSAYQDGAGKWWFGAWFNDAGVRVATKKTETK